MDPTQIGKYEIRRRLGEGATSIVYLAWDPFKQQEVAIKQLRSEVLRDPVRGRLYRQIFLNESAFAGRLRHPHIIHIHDAIIDDDKAYVVMDYLPGGTLEALCRADPLPPLERVLEIIFKATRALDYAFHQGVIHRDIKPANILLVSPEGTDIRISDFGAALATAHETTQISGLGSPAYMSPQQVREVPLDHRTDIYSLGIMLFELLTGRLPYTASNNYSLLYSIAHDPMPLPSSIRPGLPAELDNIVRRATEKDVEHRYQHWAEFSHDLAQAFRNHGIAGEDAVPTETERFEALRRMHFFRDFADAELWEVVKLARFERVRKGTVIMKEDEGGDTICFILEGEALVRKRNRLLHILTPGECFGEVAVFSAAAGTRSASVESSAATSLISLRAHALRRASETCRMHFYKAFLEVLATRLSQASARLANQ
ncbi:MAG: protein kinase [Thauera sp.]|jgi:serine/threonine protein kinase|nr:protein kinase [Thauera sp.]